MTEFLEKIDQDETDLDQLRQLTVSLVNMRKRIEQAEKALKDLQKIERQLSSEDIPTFLQSKGIDMIKLETGEIVEIKEDVKVSLPKDREKRSISLDFISRNDGDSIIKDELKLDEPTDEIIDYLISKSASFRRDKYINPMTLKAFFNDALGLKKNSIQKINIEDIPKELNVFIYKKTNIK